MRCLGRGAGVWLLLLTSLFFLVSCGIPTFINLDSDIELERVGSPALPHTVKASITLSSSSETLSKLTEYYDSGEGPSLKLFYVISSSPSTVLTNYVSESGISYQISQIETDFRNLIKTTSGSGIPWNVQNAAKAPGFYLYNDPEKLSVRESSLERPKETDLDKLVSGALIGTFAQRSAASSDFSLYTFGTHPTMDIPVSHTTGTAVPLTITLSPVLGENVNVLILSYDSNELYLTDFMKKGFPNGTWTADMIGTQYEGEDETFYKELATGLWDDHELYIHIFGSIYGGEGNFTNIYWSDLIYLGNIELTID
jgi:hypothetical protein